MHRQLPVWEKIGLDGTMGEIKGFQNILPSAQTQRRLQGPPTKSKFLAVQGPPTKSKFLAVQGPPAKSKFLAVSDIH